MHRFMNLFQGQNAVWVRNNRGRAGLYVYKVSQYNYSSSYPLGLDNTTRLD